MGARTVARTGSPGRNELSHLLLVQGCPGKGPHGRRDTARPVRHVGGLAHSHAGPPIAPIAGSLGAAVEEPLKVVLSDRASVDKVGRIAW